MDKVRKALVQKLLKYRLPENTPLCNRCVWLSGEGNRRLCIFGYCVLRYGWNFKKALKGFKK